MANTVKGRLVIAWVWIVGMCGGLHAIEFGDYSVKFKGSGIIITGYSGAGGAVTIPSSILGKPVVSIGDDVFKSRTDILSIAIPGSVKDIGHRAFGGCIGLTSLDLPNGLTSIGGFSFAGCHGFPTVAIPSTVTNIGVNAFFDCKSLTAFQVDESNPNYASLNGVLLNKQKDMLLQYPGGLAGEYSIPDTVKIIRVRAFFGCNGLPSIHIPSGVTTIGHMAFGECEALRSIRIPGSVNSIENGAFLGCENLKRVYFGGNAPAVEMPTFPNVSGFKIIRTPESTGFDVPPWTDFDVEIFSRRSFPIN